MHRVLTLKLRMERYEVELIEQYDKLNLYSIRIDGHEYTEFEEFVLRFSDNDEYKEAEKEKKHTKRLSNMEKI